MITGTPPTTDAEFADRVAAIDAAPDAEESLRWRVARAMYELPGLPVDWGESDKDIRAMFLDEADAAIAVMRGQS